MASALEDAHRWLEGRAEVRRSLFFSLNEVVTARNTKQVREHQVRVDATAGHERTEGQRAAEGR